MSDTTADDKKPKPIFNPDDVVEPTVDFGPSDPKPVDPTPADVAVEEPAVAKPVDEPVVVEKPKPARKPKVDKVDEPVAASATGEVAPADSAFAGREVVYVQAPIPPKLRGNRGVGSLLAVLGAVLFAALFGVAVIIAFFFRGDAAPLSTFALFIQNAAFWVPVLVFLVAFVLLVLIVNRAGWAAHVFGSLVVALVTYFGSIGLLLLIGNISAAATGGGTPTFGSLALNPFVIIAALVAREVSIWIGLAISARGRRVKAKNLELVDEWEQEHAETKAQYERAGATT
jgi:hypothetical protein